MDAPSDDLGLRSVKLKVLYTFDAEHKNNHLARWPQSVDVQTAFVDEATEIGVIDLRKCLEAVTSSSPELISKLDSDFNIYAYDYSEPDAPLVGQGLLSRALASDGTDGDIDEDSGGMVTGRITRGMMGLLVRNAQETLEVKLRLTPVASSTQTDYYNTLQRYRQGSVGGIETGQEQQYWNNGMQNSGGMTPTGGYAQIPRVGSPMDARGFGQLQQMPIESMSARQRSGSFTGEQQFQRSTSRPPSRGAMPMLSQPLNPPQRQASGSGSGSSRPSSRAGMRQPASQRRDSFNSGYFSGEDTFEEGPAKKRAKIMKVDAPGKSSFNIERQPESLRVVASAASSVRIHRPTPVNPALSLQTGGALEEPVRPPTPVPKSARPPNLLRPPTSSNLRRGSPAPSSSPVVEHTKRHSQLPETSIHSPEEHRPRSVSTTPANFPSSPPVIPENPLQPTSPALPPYADHNNPGFMNNNFDDVFTDHNEIMFDDFIDDSAIDNTDFQFGLSKEGEHDLSNFAPVFEEGNEIEDLHPPKKSQPILPTLAPAPPHPPVARAQSFIPPRMGISSPRLAPAPYPQARHLEEQMRASTSVLPQIAASDPPGRSLHRSNTWAGDMSDLPGSDTPVGGSTTAARKRKKVGKEQTKARLEAAISTGGMPPFCDNCGCIETPAWRRAFCRVFDCPFDDVETSLEDGACVFKEVTEYNEDGTVKLFKGYKVTKRPEDSEDDWATITLCNPCGLWFHKQKCMRPPTKWNKRDPKEKRKRRYRPRSERVRAKKTSGTNSKSDAATPASDGSSPTDTATEAADVDDQDNQDEDNNECNEDDNEPELPPMPRVMRAASADPVVQLRRTGTRGFGKQLKATQSSPARPHVPVAETNDVNFTPQSIMRQLFPSPEKRSRSTFVPAQKLLNEDEGHLPALVRRSPRLNKTKDVLTLVPILQAAGVENEPSMRNAYAEQDMDDLFGDDDELQLPPMTPTPKRRSDRILFKTPLKPSERTPGAELSPNVRRLPKIPTPKIVASHHPAAAVLLGVNKTTADMTPFTRQIHDALSDAISQNEKTSPNTPAKSAVRRTPKKATPLSSNMFDFPDLPSLNGSSPMTASQLLNFDFSELTTDHMQSDFTDVFNTDAPMPSSPPPGLFNFVDPGNSMTWADVEMAHAHVDYDPSIYPETAMLEMASSNPLLPRRSPRKKA